MMNFITRRTSERKECGSEPWTASSWLDFNQAQFKCYNMDGKEDYLYMIVEKTSFGFENQVVHFFCYIWNRFRLLDTDSGFLTQIWTFLRPIRGQRIIQSDTWTCNLIQIRFYFVLHLIHSMKSRVGKKEEKVGVWKVFSRLKLC